MAPAVVNLICMVVIVPGVQLPLFGTNFKVPVNGGPSIFCTTIDDPDVCAMTPLALSANIIDAMLASIATVGFPT